MEALTSVIVSILTVVVLLFYVVVLNVILSKEYHEDLRTMAYGVMAGTAAWVIICIIIILLNYLALLRGMV